MRQEIENRKKQIKLLFPSLYADGVEGMAVTLPQLSLINFSYDATKFLLNNDFNSDFILHTATINNVKYGFITKTIVKDAVTIVQINERVRIINDAESIVIKEELKLTDDLWIKAQRLSDELTYRLNNHNSTAKKRQFLGMYGEIPKASDKSTEQIKLAYIKKISVYAVFCLSMSPNEKANLLFSKATLERIEDCLRWIQRKGNEEVVKILQSGNFKKEALFFFAAIIGFVLYLLMRRYGNKHDTGKYYY